MGSVANTLIPPLPLRRPIIKEIRSAPEAASPKQAKQDRKSVTRNGEAKSIPDRVGISPKQGKRPVVEGQSSVDRGADRGAGGESITDVLAGGL
jgi:hypothetical protein